MSRAPGHVLLVGIALLGGCDLVFGLDGSGRPTRLRFDNATSTTDLIDFPVLVSLDASVIDYAAVIEPTTDLRFLDPATKTELLFEVDHWDRDGESAVWVRVPKIQARSVTDEILMEVGPNVGSAAPSAADVWRGSYELVSHLQVAAPTVSDALGRYPGTPDGVTLGVGTIGAGLTFGDTSIVTYTTSKALLDGWDQFTVELWLDPDYASPAALSGEPQVMSKYEPLNNCRVIFTGALQCDVQFATAATAYLNTQVIDRPSDQPWSYIVYASDGQTLSLFQNGAIVGETEASALTTSSVPEPFVLGNPNRQSSLRGTLDEIRVSHVGHSPDWVHAQYLSMTRAFVRFK